MKKRLLLIIIVGFLVSSCLSNKRDRSARQRYHVKRGCGCTSLNQGKTNQIDFLG